MFCNNDGFFCRKVTIEYLLQNFIDISLPVGRIHENIVKFLSL